MALPMSETGIEIVNCSYYKYHLTHTYTYFSVEI